MNQGLTKLTKGQIRHGVVFDEKAFLARLKKEHQAAEQLREAAGQKALIVGQMLIELKAVFGPHGNWLSWLAEAYPEFHPRKAQRWMEIAETVLGQLKLPEFSADLPLSIVLTSNPEELPKQAAEAQQLVFDFTEGKTMKELMGTAVVEGEVRGLKGKATGGTRGENRKDWALYFGENLNGALAHAKHWTAFSATQKHEAEKFTKLFLGSIPEELLAFLGEAVSEESKARKKGKLAQPEQLGFAIKERKGKE